MGIPLRQQVKVALYILRQKLQGKKRYPLVLMLEVLFRCNLACQGCGKIDYPDIILNQRLSVRDCLDAVDECGAPIVSLPGGEPLLHKEIDQIVAGIVERRKFVYLCTNALLLEKKLHLFTPSPYLTFSIHLDGLRQEHDHSVDQEGVFDCAISAIKACVAGGFRVTCNATLFNTADPDRVIEFLDMCQTLGVEGVTLSPGYAYERAPTQEFFLQRHATKQLFRQIFRGGRGKRWNLSHSSLYLDFLAGNQRYFCTPWGNPTRNIFGWQRPCYLLNEGYTETFTQLMEETEWGRYGTGYYEKCMNCMAHCGYEPTAVEDSIRNPLKLLWVKLRGVRTSGVMAPEISCEDQRPAEYVFDKLVDQAVRELPPVQDRRRTRRQIQKREKVAL